MQLSGKSGRQSSLVMEWCLRRAARSTETCFIDSRRLGAPRAATQVEHTNLLVPVLSEAPARSSWREQRSRCLSPPGSVSEFGHRADELRGRDRRVDASHPIPHLICGNEVAPGSVLQTGVDGQKCCNLSQKRFGDFFCGVKRLRRFILL